MTSPSHWIIYIAVVALCAAQLVANYRPLCAQIAAHLLRVITG